MDLNIIIDVDVFREKDSDGAAWQEMRDAATSCTPVRVSDEQLKTFRGMQGGQCRPCDLTDEDCPTENAATADSASGHTVSRALSMLLLLLAAAVLPLC